MFFWNSLAFFRDPVDVGNLISGSSAFPKSSMNIWKFTVHVLLKPGLESFKLYFASMWDEVHIVSQSYGFSGSHIRMRELDNKEGWALKNWWFWIVVLEKTLKSPLDSKEIKPVNPKGNQPWIFTEGLLLKLQYLGHLMQRANSLVKTLMLGKVEVKRRRG